MILKINHKKLYKFYLIIVLSTVTIVLFVDTIRFISICNNTYSTPWHSNDLLLNPVETTILLTQPSREFWSKNYIQTQWWYIRETEFNGKTFWTILNKSPINKI